MYEEDFDVDGEGEGDLDEEEEEDGEGEGDDGDFEDGDLVALIFATKAPACDLEILASTL